MKIEVFVTGMLGTNSYVVVNEEKKEAVIIDPAALSKKMKDFIETEGLTVKAVLLTHAHFDHIMGLDEIMNTYGELPVYVEEQDLPLLQNAELNESKNYSVGYRFDGGDVIHDGEILHLIGQEFQVIHTPGHTAGGVCYYLKDMGVLFSGDTLFRMSVGRTDFQTSNTEALLSSIKERLYLLPDETIVYPGHMGATKIGYEKRQNPYV